MSRSIIIGIGIIALAIVGLVWYSLTTGPAGQNGGDLPGEPETVTNEEQNLEFTYQSGDEGFTLLESAAGTTFGDPQLVKAYTLVETQAYNENNESTEGLGNEIPTISVLVFDKVDEPEATTTADVTVTTDKGPTTTATATAAVDEGGQTLREWAAAHSGFTAYGLRAGEPEDTSLDGADAIRYMADGPFQSEVYVVDYRNKYYVIIGQYADEDSDIRRAFNTLIGDIFFL